jgi:hypothetical protein
VLSVLPRYTDSDYPFGIFKLFLKVALNTINLTTPTVFKRSTKHTHKTKDRVTRTPLKTVGEQYFSYGGG